MYLHREGYGILFKYLGIFLVIILIVQGLSVDYPLVTQVTSVFLGIVYIWMISFFRIPKRSLTYDENKVIASADGKVVVIEKTFVKEHLNEERIQVSIFMSPLNVHINRSPIKGQVSYHKYHEGEYLVAYHPKSSTLNEHNSYAFKNARTEIMIKQIAGKLARRIRFYVKKDQKVAQNEEIGFIRFGSRVDMFIPLDAKILVKHGQNVKGGVTPIAELI